MILVLNLLNLLILKSIYIILHICKMLLGQINKIVSFLLPAGSCECHKKKKIYFIWLCNANFVQL
jgi:hypothetical protein